MKKALFRSFLLVIVILSVIFSILLVKWLQSTIFFDLFYFGKSVSYGYIHRGIQDWKIAGLRAQDNIQLNEEQNACKVKDKVINNKFTIAIIGDSYVWGQGLTEEQRFTHILEKNLSKYIDVKVISLAAPGDDLVANYAKYLLAKEKLDVDLYIFGLVHNDLLFNSYNHYIDDLITQVSKDCDLPLFLQLPESTMSYETQVVSSFGEMYGNNCVAMKIVGRLPKERAVYFDYFETYRYDASAIKEYTEIFENRGLEILSATDLATIDEYQKKYSVSKTEGHPSYWANQIFAETLERFICEKYISCVSS